MSHTPILQQFFDQVAQLQQREKTIRQSKDLTASGMKSALQGLEGQRQTLRANAYTAFSREWTSARQAMTAIDLARKTAAQNERKSWDYQALAYETDRVKAVIARATNFSQLQEAFKSAKNDPLMIRAFCDALASSGGGLIGNDKDMTGLRVMAAAELAKVRNTPELQKVEANGRAVADRVIMLFDDTKEFSMLVRQDPLGDNIMAISQNEFDRLTEGVRIEREFQDDGQGFKITVHIDDDPVKALAAGEPTQPQAKPITELA